MPTRIHISPSLRASVNEENVKPATGINKRRLWWISLLAILIAAGSSLIAKILVKLIYLITDISFFGRVSLENINPSSNALGGWVIVVPAIGGIVVGLMALYGSMAIRGHGIPEAMEQILTNKSKIKPVITFLKPVSSAIAIGTGGPFGAEGPIIATGAALGSTVGQLLKITHNERKILLAAGATAGMSAIFGSPIAGIFLAIELLLFEFSARSIVPVALACITGAAGHHLLFEAGPVFLTNAIISYPSNTALAAYSTMGIVMGLFSVITTKIVYIVEDYFEKLPIHWIWWPALGGIAVGFIGYFSPRTLGVGYNNITDILSGTLNMRILLSICLLKFISWAIALGSGTSGGTLAPLLTIGGAAGSLLGIFTLHFFPFAGVSVELSALVGMSALFAGASRAFLTAIIFALETTAQSNALLPLLATCGASYIVSLFLMKNTIMTEKIARRGIRTPESFEPDVLEHINAADVLVRDLVVVAARNTIAEVRDLLSVKSGKIKFIVISDDAGAYVGFLKSDQIFSKQNNSSDTVVMILEEQPYVVISENHSLRAVAEQMALQEADVALVTAENNEKELVGILSSHDIVSIYKRNAEEHLSNRAELSISRGLKLLVRRKVRKD